MSGTGPILIQDKSTFQMLSAREHFRRSMHFYDNLVPVLAMEILGDLTKVLKSGQNPAEKVAELAGKFHGSGGPVNHNAQTLVVHSLIGNDIPMTGQIPAQGGRQVDHPQFGRGFMIDLTWWNEAILRWTRGQFSNVEHQYSELWRTTTHGGGFSSVWDNMCRHGIILPAVKSRDELRAAVDDVSNQFGLQDAWLDILMRQFRLEDREVAFVSRRWRSAMRPLRTFAPYAFHCLKVWIGLVFVVHNRLFRWSPTHVVDMQYLNYLPFCQVFSSNDTLHKILVPALKRDDQTFLTGDELKAASRDEENAWAALEPERHDRLHWALNSPLPRRGSLMFDTWRRYMRSSVGTNTVCSLSDEQRQLAIDEGNSMLNEALSEQPVQT